MMVSIDLKGVKRGACMHTECKDCDSYQYVAAEGGIPLQLLPLLPNKTSQSYWWVVPLKKFNEYGIPIPALN